MRLKISENEYKNPTLKYKSKENYCRCVDIVEDEYLNKIPRDIYLEIWEAFEDVECEDEKGFFDIYDNRVIKPKATKLFYNKLTYSIDELINDMSNIIDDYVDYNVGYVGFDGIRLLDEDGGFTHIGLSHELYDIHVSKYYDSLQEVLDDLVNVKNLLPDTKIRRLYIELY